MKTTVKFILAILVAFAFSFNQTCEGHGGGGGGHGGGGGGYGGHSGGYGGGYGGHSGGYGGYGGMSHPSGSSYGHPSELSGSHNYTPEHHEGSYNHSSYPEYNHGGYNHPETINNNTYNHSNYSHNSNYGEHGNYGNWNHSNWNDHGHGNWNNYGHNDWHHGNWYYHPAAWWTAGFFAGEFAATAPWSWGYWPYYNPYCGEPVVVGETTIDYSQPIVLANVDDAAPAKSQGATSWFESARKDFYNGDYQGALEADEQALAATPSDAAMNEFRGLSLFATKKYKDAAGVMYAVLSAGPGWDWNTLIGLYADPATYTTQLRSLEDYIKANPSDAAAHFLLAYHYLACTHTDAAASQLREVVKLNPQDTLSAQLLKGLTEKETTPVSAVDAAAPVKPVSAAALSGSWKSSRPDGSSIALTLAADGTYTWKYTQKDKTQQFSGPYTVADNLLILKENEKPMMVGQVTTLGENSFNFKLPGDNPSDPGLTFSK
jgi:tetratricopeptide (TPR) repeat protein